MLRGLALGAGLSREPHLACALHGVQESCLPAAPSCPPPAQGVLSPQEAGPSWGPETLAFLGSSLGGKENRGELRPRQGWGTCGKGKAGVTWQPGSFSACLVPARDHTPDPPGPAGQNICSLRNREGESQCCTSEGWEEGTCLLGYSRSRKKPSAATKRQAWPGVL